MFKYSTGDFSMSQEQQQQQTNTRLTELNHEKHRDFTPEQKQEIISKGNPKIDNNVVKGYN
jgi:hypothetical protein